MMTSRKVVSGLTLLSSIEAIAALIFLLMIPSDPKNAVFLGFSTARFLLAGGLFFAAAFMAAASVSARRCPAKVNDLLKAISSTKSRLFMGGSFLACAVIAAWILISLPAYRFGDNALEMERLLPFIVWMGLVGFQALIALLIWQKVIDPPRLFRSIKTQRDLWRLMLAGFVLLLLGWVAAFPLGLLSGQDALYFNTPGVPLLGLQALIAWLMGCLGLIGFGWIIKLHSQDANNRFLKKLDWGIVVVIWAASAWLWIRTPMLSTFLAPGPYPPDGVVFPLVDAALYDRTAQFALMGLRMNNGQYVDKPLYTSFLTFLHLLAGQDYQLLATLQTVVLAGVPAVAYLIGKKVHSRAAGLAAALLVLFRGINAIAGGHWIQTAHSRLFLSEMPTALALVLLTLWLVCWFQKPRDLIYPLLAGGTLGLSTLIRHNPWLLLPIILITALIVNWPHWKRWLGQAALFLLMLVAVISPWMIYSQKYIGTPFYFTMPLRGTIWKERYLPELEGTSLLPDMVPGQQFSLAGASVAGSGFMQNPSQIVQQQENPPSGFAVVARFVAVHFINNFNSTILILPGSLIFDDLDRTLSDPTSVWQQDWDGKVSGVLMFNITLALLGVVTAWRKWRLAGTAPLIVYLGYLIALAGARTSGGRYIVPVDWVVMLYYAIGLVQISAWLFGLEKGLEAHPDSKQTPAGKWRYFAAVGGLLLIVGMIPVAQEAFPKNVPPAGMDALPSKDWFLDKEIRQQDVTNFLDQEGAEVLSGRVVYPRLYRQDEGDHNECYESLLYPRLVFELLNEDGVHCVILPYDKSIENVKLHATQAVVFRCAESTAWAVLVPELDTALLRAPSVDSLRCPLPDPVCDNNRNCK